MSHRPASEKKGNARSPRIPSWKWPWTRGWGRHGTPARCPTSPAAAHSPAAQRRRTARRPKGVRGGRGSCPPRSGGRGMAAVSGAQWARNISFYNDRYIFFFVPRNLLKATGHWPSPRQPERIRLVSLRPAGKSHRLQEHKIYAKMYYKLIYKLETK